MDEDRDHDIELIFFVTPVESSLYLPKVQWNDSKESLTIKLQNTYSEYGLVHFVFVGEKSCEEEGLWYAYVTFYSSRIAERAKTRTHLNLVLGGRACAVFRQARPSAIAGKALATAACETLANFYLGFSGWSSELLYHRLESESLSDDGLTCTLKFCSAVRLRFKGDDRFVEGSGIATVEYPKGVLEAKGGAMAKASKFSRMTALQNAFSKVVLVVVDGTKTTVEFDSTKIDPFHYDPLWEEHAAIVTEVSDCPLIAEEEDIN